MLPYERWTTADNGDHGLQGAMNESLGGSENWPDERIVTAYKQWGAGNWGGLITGNFLPLLWL